MTKGATSRRSFLHLAGTASICALVRSSWLAAAMDPPNQASLPPSIAALQSMREQAKPITVDERHARLERARELMGKNHIDAILLPGGTSLLYFTGVRWDNSERLFAAVVPASGEGFCVCPSFEEGRAREQLNRGP